MANPNLAPGKQQDGHGPGAVSSVVVTDSSAVVLTAPSAEKVRTLLQLQNCADSGGGDIFISFGAAASLASAVLRLPPYGLVIYDQAVPQGTVNAVTSAALTPTLGLVYIDKER